MPASGDDSAMRDEAGVAIVIVNFRTPDLALRSLAALAEERGRVGDLRVVMVDGGSDDGSAETLAAGLADAAFADWVEWMPLPINGGFSWANNQAILHLLQGRDPPEFIHLLNPDTIIHPGAVAALLDELRAHPRCAAAGSLLLDMDGSPSGSAFRFPSLMREYCQAARFHPLNRLLRVAPVVMQSARAAEAEWVTGASVMLRCSALDQIGLFDDGFFLYFEEVELMWRLRRAGWSVRHQPESRVRHVGGASTGLHMRVEKDTWRSRRPAYWYRSRRRFFMRTRGTAYALVAGLAWLAGLPVWWLRLLCGRIGAQRGVEKELRDFLAFGFLPVRSDLRSAIVRTNAAAGSPPAWMRRP